ncbi:MAG: hypothetical protein Unbinned5607contig1000_56 [Prokaryotic dsDNA virus sp.]|nr:MAG: hypothetical protein Unbinned5607contig1000_56 [Prokaryotic dsDNA virus sp.]|tara:strand:+ start:24354 stop:24650 length:297 start_codon:yes stop_codon:yes gene_type:complete
MGHLLALKLDVKKIPKEKYFNGEKGVYIDLTLSVNDEPNQFGQTISAWVEQSKEERENKVDRVFVGNGSVIWTDGKELPVRTKEQTTSTDGVDLPFEL